MTIHVAITTCNRAAMVQRLIDALFEDACGFKLDVWVYDDGSTPAPKVDSRCTWWRYREPHGRESYWELVDDVFKDAKRCTWDRFLMIPDDVEPVPGFLGECERIWMSIEDPRKSFLNYVVDSRGHILQWTDIEPNRHGEVWLVGWNDCALFCERDTLEALEYKMHPVDMRRFKSAEVISSGVGVQLSHRLNERGKHLYQVDKTLVHHGEHPSVMHPNRAVFL